MPAMPQKFRGLFLLAWLLTGCSSDLPEARLKTDVLAQSYVKNCEKQGLKATAEFLEQTKSKQGRDVSFVLHFSGQHTAQTRALLCDKNMGVTLKYTYQNGQAVVQRLQLQPTRRQLSVLKGG